MEQPWHPTTGEIAAVFAPLERFERLILAVSGGSDSMALLNLAARWQASRGADTPTLEVATVDHGLRPGSREEAQRVGDVSHRLGLTHHILTWSAGKLTGGLQDRARQARYALLGELARRDEDVRPVAIVTAHTQEDQAETVLMRIARGSGPDGLQGMRAARPLDGGTDVMLVRPLLGLSRASLRSWLLSEGLSWIEDPSNQDERFERVRLRNVAPVLANVGLTAPMLALAARRQARAVEALESATEALASTCVSLHGGAFASLDGTAFAAAPGELRIRLLGRVLRAFGGTSPDAELAQVERLADDLAREKALRVTLGGCQIRACPRQIRVFREPGRADLGPRTLSPGQTIDWDGRFRIVVGAGPASCGADGSGSELTARPLDPGLLRDLRRLVRPRLDIPARAAATLPAIWRGKDLIAVGGVPDRALSVLSHKAHADQSVCVMFLFDAALARLASCDATLRSE